MKIANVIVLIICLMSIILFVNYRAPVKFRVNHLSFNYELYNRVLPKINKEILNKVKNPYDYILSDILLNEKDSTYFVQLGHLNFIRGKYVEKEKPFISFVFSKNYYLISMPDTSRCLLF
jgi:hypothetical protein